MLHYVFEAMKASAATIREHLEHVPCVAFSPQLKSFRNRVVWMDLDHAHTCTNTKECHELTAALSEDSESDSDDGKEEEAPISSDTNNNNQSSSTTNSTNKGECVRCNLIGCTEALKRHFRQNVKEADQLHLERKPFVPHITGNYNDNDSCFSNCFT
jgi:hypothetical protein